MKILKRHAVMLIMLSTVGASPAYAANTTPSGVAPDNSGTNVRDRQPTEATADNAGGQASDREIMSGIRQSLVSDKSLSTYAHNIKIISANGKVTLKGPVQSDAESKTIEDKATQVAGPGNVTNELSVNVTR